MKWRPYTQVQSTFPGCPAELRGCKAIIRLSKRAYSRDFNDLSSGLPRVLAKGIAMALGFLPPGAGVRNSPRWTGTGIRGHAALSATVRMTCHYWTNQCISGSFDLGRQCSCCFVSVPKAEVVIPSMMTALTGLWIDYLQRQLPTSSTKDCSEGRHGFPE